MTSFVPLEKPIPVKEQKWPKGTRPLVSVWCAAYNHERFISQAVESFLAQATTFPVQIILHDDASTDESVAIIQSYYSNHQSSINVCIQRENLLSKNRNALGEVFAVRSAGELVAFCDGDDYWTDPTKLQKQAQLMLENQEIALCYHPVVVENHDRATGSVIEGEVHPKNFAPMLSFDDLLGSNPIPTCSILIRKSALLYSLPRSFAKVWACDWPRWIWAALQGKIVAIPDVMACYRVHSGGAWSGLSKEARKWQEFQLWRALGDIVPATHHAKLDANALDSCERALATGLLELRPVDKWLELWRLGLSICRSDRTLFKRWLVLALKTMLGRQTIAGIAKFLKRVRHLHQ